MSYDGKFFFSIVLVVLQLICAKISEYLNVSDFTCQVQYELSFKKRQEKKKKRERKRRSDGRSDKDGYFDGLTQKGFLPGTVKLQIFVRYPFSYFSSPHFFDQACPLFLSFS